MSKPRARATTVLLAAVLVGVVPGAASGETVAGNDEIAGATQITALPYHETQDTAGATAAADDPKSCWSGGFSVWYTLVAPADGTLRITDFVSRVNPETGGTMDAASGVAVFAGTPDALVELDCELTREEGGSVDVAVAAGQSLWVLAGSLLTDSTGTAVILEVRYLQPPRVTAALDPVGAVTRDGVATVTGTVQCDVGAPASVFVTLTQARGPVPRTSSDSTSLDCSTTGSRWSVTLPPSATRHPVRPGRARVEALVTAGADDVTQVPLSGSVVLRPQ